jgi:Reverse transcriptase (RNA-dependent DNA polymerase).
MHHSKSFQARRLKTGDPRIRKRYVHLLHQTLEKDKVYDRFDKLMFSPHGGLLPTDVLQFEVIDRDITNAMEYAERKCRKLHMGEVKWSPLYQKACDRVTYWTMAQKEAEGHRVNTRKLISLRKKLGLQRGNYTLTEIATKLKEATRDRQKCKKYAPELQADYRYRLAIAMEKEDNIAAATHIRNLSHQENTRALFRRIRYMERKLKNLSTIRVTTRTRRGKKVELVQKEDVERCILQENERKYHQTEGTGQLQRGQLLHDLGAMGEGQKVEALLNGHYAPPMGTSRHTKDFLRVMKTPPDISPVPPITFHEFQVGWKKAKERTSSNGPHFGHYKASMYHPHIAKLLYKRALLPVVTGYAPRRHRQGIDVMLLKKENTYDVDRLRTIVLFDSEANMNYKHLGRRAMNAAIASDQIATEQYSRPNRKAIDHALNRRLVIDHQLYLRQPYAITSCDLKSCYDRINHTAASLTLQRLGIAKSEILTMFTSIQYMLHRVRTAFGDSTHTYGGMSCDKKWTLPPQGVLQGNGCGPAIWAILSSCIFEILRQRGHCNSIKSSIRHLLIELSGFAYVDDTDLLQINDTVEEVVQYMQQKILDWNDNIGVTGGVLSPSKCWWYLVTFQYIAGKWKAVSPQGDFTLWLKNESKKRVEIDKIHPSQGINMLGVHIAPDGNNRDQVKALRLKVETWVNNVRSSRANMEEVWTALHRTIPFSVCYPLPAVTLTPEDCKYIMAPITKYGLPLTGIASTTPTAVKVGSLEMGGLGVIDPYVFMGTSQIENFVSNTWRKSPTGMLQEITLEDFALEMGLSMPWTTAKLQQGLLYATTHSWIRQLVQFTVSNAISIDYQLTHELIPKRDRDKTIMEAAFEYKTHKPFLKSINNIRMLTKVICLSDLVTADGRRVEDTWFGHVSITLDETSISGQKFTRSTTQTGEDGENG